MPNQALRLPLTPRRARLKTSRKPAPLDRPRTAASHPYAGAFEPVSQAHLATCCIGEPMSKRKPSEPQIQQISRIREGLPFPLGATWDGLGVNFAIFSAHATKVELCLFDASGETELERIELPEYTDEIWHGYLPDAHPGQVYGYRV